MDNFKMNIQLFAGEQTGGLDQPDQPTSTKYVGQEAMEELVIKLKQYTDNKEITLDNTVTQNSSNGVKSSGIYSALQTKQDVINASSKLSSDFVDDTGATHKFVTTSEKNTWNAKQNALTFDSTPTLNSTNPVTSGGVYGALSGKQDVLTFDTAPTENSANPVTSGGLYTKFNLKADKTAAVGSFDLTINNTTYVITLQAKDVNGNNLGTAKTIDLPLESVVVSGSYDSATKKVILTLKDGSTIDFSVADLISGLQSEITSTNKLSADLVDDTNTTHKFVTSSDKTTWNNKQNAITSSAKLSADLVDDTNATNKFVTSTEKSTWNSKQDAMTAITTAEVDALFE